MLDSEKVTKTKDERVSNSIRGQGNTALYENGQEDQAEVYKSTSAPTKYYEVGEGSNEYRKIGVRVIGR